MRITELVLKNFGRFTDKRIGLTDGINIIYGENESGKSTLHTFLKGMLFGMERKRGRAAATDTFSTYEPWENPNYYAGILRFECGIPKDYFGEGLDGIFGWSGILTGIPKAEYCFVRMMEKSCLWSMEIWKSCLAG